MLHCVRTIEIRIHRNLRRTNRNHTYIYAMNKPVESKTRTYHGRVGAGRRTAGRRRGAGPGRTGRRRIGSPRRQPSLVPSRASNTPVLNVSSEARTSETLSKKTDGGTKRPVGVWFIRGTKPALRSRRLLVSGKPFHAKHTRELFPHKCVQLCTQSFIEHP